MHDGKAVAVAMPAYNEEENIFDAVESFSTLSAVDDVIVVDNNSDDQTAQLARKAGARVVFEENQGYGHACQRGLSEGSEGGDLLVLVEPDSTFVARDLNKLLAYTNDCDVVYGTRTASVLIWEDAKMGRFLRWGNWALAKCIEVLYNTPNLTDVGCTFRVISAEAFEKIEPDLTVGGSHFSPEMIIRSAQSDLSMIEVPVNYRPRKGDSKITDTRWSAFVLGITMTRLIVRERFRS